MKFRPELRIQTATQRCKGGVGSPAAVSLGKLEAVGHLPLVKLAAEVGIDGLSQMGKNPVLDRLLLVANALGAYSYVE